MNPDEPITLRNGDGITWQETVVYGPGGVIVSRTFNVCPRCGGKGRVPAFVGSMACPSCKA